MIPFDFEYYSPSSPSSALDLYQNLQRSGKEPMYYSGGTEVITFARRNSIQPRAVIDLKAIPECNALYVHAGRLIIGSCVSLSRLAAANPFPLLSRAAEEIADQTARNKITLGGNISGIIIYREAVLPLLLADSQLVIIGPNGIKHVSIHQVFRQRLQLQKGEALLQIVTDQSFTTLPYFHRKKRQIGHVGYPLVTVAALLKDGRIRVSLSGVCAFPFRSIEIEQILNDRTLPPAERIKRSNDMLPAPVLSNAEGSADYRIFTLNHTLADAMELLEGRS